MVLVSPLLVLNPCCIAGFWMVPSLILGMVEGAVPHQRLAEEVASLI